ncbi:glyoxalase [Mycobacterium lehmannii]|uniref:Glyoxalase n=1 Tax=Mycobacterium lehmannii TaxID=2048550 RepID=A0A124EPH6_9MYCO|nr:VOC family protein [Mycobacterium lehmannii]KUI15509.1 glyoxalase [Mycobacterium lehmannii]
MSTVCVRYIVDDVDSAVQFYTNHLRFDVDFRPGPGFAMLHRDELRLLLNSPGGGGGAGEALSDGSRPAPGGWNRIQLEVNDLDDTVSRLSDAGVSLRADVITGRGGRQALISDPSGNLVELFEPSR